MYFHIILCHTFFGTPIQSTLSGYNIADDLKFMFNICLSIT